MDYVNSDMSEFACTLAEQRDVPPGGAIPLEIFLEAYAQMLPSQRKYTTCRQCEELATIALVSRGPNPLVLQIDILMFYNIRMKGQSSYTPPATVA